MTEQDKSNRLNLQQKGQGKPVGTSVLVAAVSLLGSTLGIAAAATEPQSIGVQGSVGQSALDQDSARQNAVQSRGGEASELIAVNIKANTTVPKINPPKVKPPSANIKGTWPGGSNQIKSSNQIKY